VNTCHVQVCHVLVFDSPSDTFTTPTRLDRYVDLAFVRLEDQLQAERTIEFGEPLRCCTTQGRAHIVERAS